MCESAARKQSCAFDGFSKLAQEPPFDVSLNQRNEKETFQPVAESDKPENVFKMLTSAVGELKSALRDFAKATAAISGNGATNNIGETAAGAGGGETNEDSSFEDVKRQQTHKLQAKLEVPTATVQNHSKRPVGTETRDDGILNGLLACVVHQEN